MMNVRTTTKSEPLYVNHLSDSQIAGFVKFAANNNGIIRFEYDHDEPTMTVNWTGNIDVNLTADPINPEDYDSESKFNL